MRRILTAAALAATAGTMLFSSPASAGLDYGTICQLAFTPTPPFAPGGAVVVDGTGFPANFATQLLFDGQPFSPPEPVLSDGDGEFTESVTIPADAAPGAHTISAICDANNQTPVDFPVEVLGSGQVAPVLVVDPNNINCAATLAGFADLTQPNSQVTFRVRTPAANLATVTSNNTSGRADFSVPNFSNGRAAGEYEIVSNGTNQQGAPFEISVRVNLTLNNCNAVTPTTSARVGGGSVPRTGTDAGPMVAMGGGALVLGAAFVSMSRRRRRVGVAS